MRRGSCGPMPGFKFMPLVMFGAVLVSGWMAFHRRPLATDRSQGTLPALRVNLNTAGVDELQVLPSIGPSLAELIVADRKANGPFAAIEDVDRVPHIGPAVIERIRPYATVGAQALSARGGG